jgi:enoyl-CoA hydratase/carnithine racemase
MNDYMLIDTRDGVLCVRFNRPERKNALTGPMYAQLAATIEGAAQDDSVRVMVLLGSGGNFSSGNDISEPMTDFPEGEASAPLRFMVSLLRSAVPIIAGVDGVAVGIGATMLLHLDAVVVTPRARVIMPFVNLALVPEAGSSLILPRLLGYARAADLLLSGQPIDGARAHALGIATEIAAPEQLEQATFEKARRFARQPRESVRRTRALLKGDVEPMIAWMQKEGRELLECATSPEHQEAIAAFREKRPPDFSAKRG